MSLINNRISLKVLNWGIRDFDEKLSASQFIFTTEEQQLELGKVLDKAVNRFVYGPTWKILMITFLQASISLLNDAYSGSLIQWATVPTITFLCVQWATILLAAVLVFITDYKRLRLYKSEELTFSKTKYALLRNLDWFVVAGSVFGIAVFIYLRYM